MISYSGSSKDMVAGSGWWCMGGTGSVSMAGSDIVAGSLAEDFPLVLGLSRLGR